MAEAQIVIDVKASPLSEAPKVVGLKVPLHRQLDTLWGNANEAENFTIFRTPHSISQNNKNLFEPSVISIGPFHRGQQHLRALEEQKRRFLRDFLSREDEISLDLCLSAMKSLETRTRRCYNETFDDLDSDAFVEMMLLDGCFLLEYFIKKMEGNRNSIHEVGWNSHFINRDSQFMRLYELIGLNQEYKMHFVKLIAVVLLPEHYILSAPPAETPDSIIADPSDEIPDPPDEIPDPLEEIPEPPAEIHHLVHICYHYVVPNPGIPVVLSSKPFDLTRKFRANRIIKGLLHRFRSRPVRRGRSPHSTSRSLSVALPNSTGNLSSVAMPSATELKQKGLKFKPKSNSKHMLDISFEYGVLKIPRLSIDDATKRIFSNLIAFEHSKYGKEHSPFTSFVIFLDNLVNTPNDVTILQECGIFENWLSSEEELSHFLNQVTDGTSISGSRHYLAELCREVNRYCESSWNRQRAKLIRDYFSSPWAAISLVAALILLVLTCVQSFYAIYAYKFPPSS